MINPLHPEFGPLQCCAGEFLHRANCPLFDPDSELAREMAKRWENPRRQALLKEGIIHPHAFSSGGGFGTPDRPCVECGLPDRHPIHKATPGKTTWVRCGNCKKQYEVPIAQPWRYHAVQQHKFACPAGTKEAVEAQHTELIRDFAAQQTRRPVTRPWWKFWSRR